MNNQNLVHEPENPRGVIIFLHGLGDNGDNFYDGIFPLLPQKIKDNYRCIFMTAPMRPVTINGGYVMTAWYDIFSLSDRSLEDEEGIQASVKLVNEVISEQAKDDRVSDNIILFGFSQGGAIAIHSFLSTEHKISNVYMFSSYVPLLGRIKIKNDFINRLTPISFFHGYNDDVVPLEMMRHGVCFLQQQHFLAKISMLEHGHYLHPSQFEDVCSQMENLLD